MNEPISLVAPRRSERIHIPQRTMKLFTGSANPALGHEIATYLGTQTSGMHIANFSDGEIYVRVKESVRGTDVFIVQPLCHPVNYHVMELLIMLDAFKRASAHSVTAVIPYFAYARQDRKAAGREAITSKLLADLLTTAGATRVLAMDLHAPQIQGFFNILMDHLAATPVLVEYVRRKNFEDLVVVSPDVGGVTRARAFAKKIDAPIAIIDKRRPKHNQAEILNLIGDIKGKTCLILDDLVDTAGTLTEVARLLEREGAREVHAYCTHGVLSGPAIQRIQDSPLTELVITNTIPLPEEKAIPKIKVLSVAGLLGEAILRIHEDDSVSKLFE